MHKQVSGWTVNFCQNSPVCPFLEKFTPVYPPKWKTSDLRWPKFTLVYLPPPAPPKLKKFRFEMTKVYSGLPPPMENFRFKMTKVYSGLPPPQNWKTSDLRWPKFTPVYPPPKLKNFRFEMTKVYSSLPPSPKIEKLQIWDDQSLLRFTLPQIEKLQIWDDQSLLRFTPQWKTSDWSWPKFAPVYPPQLKNFRFEMTKVYSSLPLPKIEKLQIWNDQSLLRFTSPPQMDTFRLEMTKVYSGLPPPPIEKLQMWDDQSLLRFTPPAPNSVTIREIVCGD